MSPFFFPQIDAPLPARVNPLHSRQCSHGGTDNSLGEENATVHHNNTIEVVRDLLHKIPAVHVGSCKVGKQHSMSDVIHRVLADSHPSQAKEISVWLSITQLRLVDVSEKQDVIYTVHDTSTVRTIGVHPEDRRFVGYMVKEEGKPLTGELKRNNGCSFLPLPLERERERERQRKRQREREKARPTLA